MKMSIDEIIKKENEIAAKYQKAIDTHIANDNGCIIEEMCGDDSEAISKHLSLCKSIADYHKQIADTMRKYQQIEQIIDNWTRPEEIEWAIREVIDDG